MKKETIKKIAIGVLLTVAGILGGTAVTWTIKPTEEKTEVKVEASYQVEFSKNQDIPAVIENESGELVEENLPVVEEVRGEKLENVNDIDFGRGEYYDYSSPETFTNGVINKCIVIGNPWGSQCVNLFYVFHQEYTGRWADLCGTGAARGLWDCKEVNAGDEYELITDPTKIQDGDFVVFNGGEYGHVGMARGPYNNGYVALLGLNQGGSWCAEGGSAANIINMSTKAFLGAFRPKIYIQPDPEPEPEPVIPITGCKDWSVVQGDTMGGIMLTCEGVIVYGEPMNQYADSWRSQVVNPGKTVLDGWTSERGYGLFSGDYLLHEVK